MITLELEQVGDFLVNKIKDLPNTFSNFLQENKFSIEREMQIGYGKSGLAIRTGKLIKSLHTNIYKVEKGAEIKIGYEKEYASYLEHGTAPYTIHGNPILHWTAGGVDFFATKVQHPGVRAYKFLEKPSYTVAKQLQNKLPGYLKRVWE